VERITATEAARNFSDMLNRVRDQGASFEITRGNEVVARIVPAEPRKNFTVGDFIELWKRLPRLDPEDAAKFEDDLAQIRRKAVLPEPKWD
jgi:prevent-host-death family protein